MLKLLHTFKHAPQFKLIALGIILIAPVVESAPLLKRGSQENQQQQDTELSVLKAANESNALMMYDLSQQIEHLKMEMQGLRGVIEEQNFQIEQLKKFERERYSDIDQRIQALQGQSAGRAPAQVSAAATAVGDLNAEEEKTYNSAKLRLDKKEFNAAIAEFTLYLEFFPNGKYVAQTHYWLGELYRSLEIPENDSAKKHYREVVDKFPKHEKVAGSLYKLGIIAKEENKKNEARQYFERLMREFPQSSTAALAKNHLNSL